MKKLEDYLTYEQPTKYIIVNDNYSNEYDVPVLTAGKSFILGYTNEKENVFPKEKLPVIIFDDFTTDCKYVDFPFKVKSSAMKILHPINNANAKFLYYYMKKIKFDNTLHKRYWISEYSKLPIKELNDTEQNNFIKKMEKLEVLINTRNKQIENCNMLIKSQFVEMFGDPKSNDKNWIKAPMGDYMTVLTDFSSNGSYKTLDSTVVMYNEPKYAYMVRTTDLENDDYKNNVKYITKEAYNFLSKSKVYPDDIIMNKIGSAGKVYMMPDVGMPVSLGRNAFLFRYNDDIVPLFIYYLLKSEYGTNEISQYVRGAVTKTITKDDARKVKIIVPPIELQNKFADIVKQIDKQKFSNMNILELLVKIVVL